jgi:hypothetical protein
LKTDDRRKAVRGFKSHPRRSTNGRHHETPFPERHRFHPWRRVPPAATLLDEAEVLRLGGKLVESRSAAEAALVLFERKGATSRAARAHVLLAELP